MRTDIICSNNLRYILLELLTARGIVVDDRADIIIVECGHEIPKGKISIVFDIQNMGRLVEFLDMLSRISDVNISTIVGKREDKYEIISLKQVDFFEGRGNYVFCNTRNGEYKVKEKLYELESRLPQNKFIRVGKSFIVNISNVKEIIPWFGRRVVLKFNGNNAEVEVSKNYIKGFKEFIGI
jgi:two-component system, LytTR family, response regulator